ncbi:hypothetical protein DOY81_006896 [Sarcophaga bullata]|nr:hypothetical protein DOY81_006896 [Sarcophaga bullata]
MFTIMENRKRPRLELINSNNNSSNEALQGVASTTTPLGTATATLATIGGQSFILSNASATSLPANILLSICDDNSDESEEYIIDSPMLTHIKQENSVATQTTNNQTSQQLPALVTSLPQYRIVNQAGKSLNNSPLNSPNVLNTSAVANNAALLSNSVHLPPGCEIYVIKEVLDTPKQVLQNDTTVSSNKGIVSTNATTTTIKLEPMSPLPILRNSTTLNNNASQNLNANSNNIAITTNPVTTAHNTTLSTSPQDETAKRSLILEAYKKRDDKRRATHNEVERRRRDKINSWIFKLKEMLPTEVTPSNGSTILNKEAITNTTHQQQQQQQQRLLVQQQATTRTPPSDSKSQILIKACEYIKSMQEEIKSLRECLTENENLRLNNERLQDEINTLRSKQQQQQKQHLNNNNNNILITTTNNNNNNSNNSNNNNNHNNNNNNHSNTTDDCEITLNTLNTTYANVQLFAPSTTQHNNNNNHHNHNNHHHLAGLVGLTANTSNTSSPATVNVTYAKRELIITDFVD